MGQTDSQTPFKTSIGGQAILEGIMMRGPKKQAIVIRTPDGLVTKEEELKFVKDRYPILGLPFIRGPVNFIGMMVNGMKAITYSAEFMPEDEQVEPSKFDKWIEKRFGEKAAEKMIIGIAVVLGIALAVLLFFMLPTFLAGIFGGFVKNRIVNNLIEGFMRIAIFIVYMWLATRLKEMQRIWAYHGAEHKTIFCYEKGLELTVENAREQPRCHPRCGTSFMFIVMIVSILVFSVVNWTNMWVRMALRILLLPVAIAISYEIIKLAGRYENMATRILSAPGKALQRLTTMEPDDEMLEVAIEAIKLVIPEQAGADEW